MKKGYGVIPTKYKKWSLRIALVVQSVLFFYQYVTGTYGIQAARTFASEIAIVESEIAQLKNEIAMIEQEIVDWKTDYFYIEKAAREQLHMAKSHEDLYFIG
jgi:cell division protein FtsB